MRGAVIAIALLAAGAAAPAHACQLVKIAELPVTMEGLRPFVPVTINTMETKLLADSGAFYSMIDAASAKRAGVRTIPGFSLTAMGAGGSAVLGAGRADTVKLADIPLKKVEFLIHERPISSFAAGLLGQNILGAFDTEYDLAHGVIRIFRPKGCAKANLAYWSAGQDLSVVPARSTDFLNPHIRFDVRVNGVRVQAVLDSGAATTLLSASTAARAGVRPDGPGAKSEGLSGGIGRQYIETWSAPFATVSIGGEDIQKTRLRISKVNIGTFEMLLGADFFLSHRILVSNSQNLVYFTYNGGPVFRLVDPPVQGDATTAPVGRMVEAAPATAGIDSASLGRRAAAHAARRDFRSAVRDYTEALKMTPDDPDMLRGRALAYARIKQEDLAVQDLDRALKLAPGHVQSLLARGEIRLGRKDLAGAQADFAAAIKAAPEELHLPLAVADRYGDAGAFDQAIALYDDWISRHPRDSKVADAFNGRCWTRAVWNRDLNLAVADCDAALRRSRPNSATLNSRGVLRLRLGQLDAAIADLDASLKLQPNLAWSLYARGLAKARKGPPGAGDADIKAAKALDPDLAETAARYGLVPA
jgi:tetratricopeptide (TPR) repeat protein/predicted aspartyl protease